MNPGRPHASVIQPLPRPPLPRTAPSARSAAAVSSRSSTSSSSATSRCGSCGEELDIVLLPEDRDLLAFTASELRVALARDLREQPLAPRREVELDEVAEELDEEDLARGRVGPRL